jgi:hypothetical protein
MSSHRVLLVLGGTDDRTAAAAIGVAAAAHQIVQHSRGSLNAVRQGHGADAEGRDATPDVSQMIGRIEDATSPPWLIVGADRSVDHSQSRRPI